MRVICRNSYDLLSGLREARRLNLALYEQWLPRRDRWLAQQARARRLYRGSQLLYAAAGLSALALACMQGLFVLSTGRLLLSAGSLILVVLVVILLAAGLAVDRRARRIGTPVFAGQPAPVLEDIEALWWQSLAQEAQRLDDVQMKTQPKDGDEGELALMRVLQHSLPDTFFGVRGMKVIDWLDVDALVMGPSGIWVLDSKYWNGEILYDGESWLKRKTFRVRGQEQMRVDTMNAIDREWQHESEQIARILRDQRNGWDYRVKGGIVLTHPNGVFRPAVECPVRVETTENWLAAIQYDPRLREMTEDACLHGLDMLLLRAHLNHAERFFSAQHAARVLLWHQILRLLAWRRGRA